MKQAYQLHNIRYGYHSTFTLSFPSLIIPAQKITTLIGANGSGKSTLLNLLGFLISPDQGYLQFFDNPVFLKQPYDLRKKIGFLPQKPYMFRGSVINNLNLVLKLHHIPKNQRQPRITAILESLKLMGLANQSAKTLSAGELQKVALARAIIAEPKVLLMDEPFNYLDPTSVQLLEQFMLAYVAEKNTTLIFSTHQRLQGLAMADYVVSLVNGQQIETPLVNLFSGVLEKGYFKTAHLQILLAQQRQSATYISIDPRKIILSKNRAKLSFANQYQGRVVAIIEESGGVRVSVNIGDIFQVILTKKAFRLLDLTLMEVIWLSFNVIETVVF
jgi:tungstate transport system ATP-binding protein